MITHPPYPLQYRVQALALDHNTEALRATRAWLEAPGDEWALVMLGTTGNGKSQAATVAWMVTPGAVWIRTREFETAEWKVRAEVIERAKQARLVVLDEVLAEGAAATEIIGDIGEHRGDEFRKTIMLGNGNTEGFIERYGARMMSRMESSGRWLLEVQGDDLRHRVRPILERPSMPWIPSGLTDEEVEAFKRDAFIHGLDVAHARHEKRRAALPPEATEFPMLDIDAVTRRLRSPRPLDPVAKAPPPTPTPTPSPEELEFIERRQAQIRAQIEDLKARREAEKNTPSNPAQPAHADA